MFQQLSQFWYSSNTKKSLGSAVSELLKKETDTKGYSIALLSSPSLYATVKEIHDNGKKLEIDFVKNFKKYGRNKRIFVGNFYQLNLS